MTVIVHALTSMDITPFPASQPAEKDLLDRVVGRFLETAEAVSGKWLRSKRPEAIPESLAPTYLHVAGTPPHDRYRPTPKGLFCSQHAHNCLNLLDAVVSSLSRMYGQNPDFQNYSNLDVWGEGVTPESTRRLVAVISTCHLNAGGGFSCHDFRFAVPPDIEHVAAHAGGRSMLGCAVCDRTRWDHTRPPSTDVPALTSEPPSGLPLKEPELNSSFITDPELARIIQRDCDEIASCTQAGAWKAAIILCGSALEGLLTFALEATGHASRGSTLADLIALSISNGLLTKMGQALPQALRDHRNLIHPGKERGSSYSIDAPEARIAAGILEAALRDVAAALQTHKPANP